MPPSSPLNSPASARHQAGGGSSALARSVRRWRYWWPRGGLRTTLQTRTEEQAALLSEERENRVYLSGVEFPRELRVEHAGSGLARADYVFLGVPSSGLDAVIAGLEDQGLLSKAAVVSLAKGLVPPHGLPPTVLLQRRFGASRTGCMGGPAHAREMVSAGAGLVSASTEEALATALAGVYPRGRRL